MVIPTERLRAYALLRGKENLRGIVRFYETRRGTLVAAEIQGLPENDSGFFGFHIHEGISCGGKEFGDTGGHNNPEGKRHPEHSGDLPPLLSAQGRAFLAVETDRFSVREILGRTVVIYHGADDFHSQPGGDAGEKIACGVIRPV